MSDQQILPCTMCGKHHDQMLMLACVHDPCINCAAIHFHQSSQTNSSRNTYPCAKCGQLTELDSSSVIQLERLYNALVNNPQFQKKKYDYGRSRGTGNIATSASGKNYSSGKKGDSVFNTIDRFQPQKQLFGRNEKDNYSRALQQPQTHSPYPISQPSYAPSIGNAHKKPLPYICSEHPDQQISYYCFTCQKPICPECAIHGSHREHQVQTTRKAIKAIKQKMLSLNGKIGQELNAQNQRRQQWRRSMKEMTDGVKDQRQIIQQQFNKLRALINEKEKQFQKVVESNYDQNSSQIKAAMAQVDKNIDRMSSHRKALEGLAKKDDITVLQQYALREEEINGLLGDGYSKKEDEDNRKEADYRLMEEQIAQLMGILQAMRLSTGLISRH